MKIRLRLIRAAAIPALLVVAALNAQAVPSFARQTNLSCNSCHNGFPKLNAFGRLFKLNAYTLTGIKSIESTGHKDNPALKLASLVPISAMVQTSLSSLRKPEPGARAGDAEFPQQLSLFVAGEITPNLGAFIQVTYDDQSATLGWDNTDIRLATRTKLGKKSAIVGLTLNNNPTVQDVWNTAPAWGFPFAASGTSPDLISNPLLAGSLAQQVVGFGAYIFYDNFAYGELSMYASTPQGGPFPADSTSTGTLKGINPYWRLAIQHGWGAARTLEVGAYGFLGRIFPAGITGPTDDYADLGLDLQFEQALGRDRINAYATWIHEDQTLGASFPAGNAGQLKNDVESFRASLCYDFRNTYDFTVGYFAVDGSLDPILYVPASVTGSRRNQPNGSGLILEASVYPWQNAMASLQYTLYNTFNGARLDYDGFGRNAADNNTLYLVLWVAF
jgi:hypothetical protein